MMQRASSCHQMATQVNAQHYRGMKHRRVHVQDVKYWREAHGNPVPAGVPPPQHIKQDSGATSLTLTQGVGLACLFSTLSDCCCGYKHPCSIFPHLMYAELAHISQRLPNAAVASSAEGCLGNFSLVLCVGIASWPEGGSFDQAS